MKNYVVIGLGRFGCTIAKTLYDSGNMVLAIDSNIELVQKALAEELVEDAICIDATDEISLKNHIQDSFDAAFVCIGTNIQNSILVTLLLKEIGVKNIICKAKTKIQGKVLQKVGATKVIFPEESMGEKIALEVMRPSLIEHFKFSNEYSIFELEVPKSFVGKTLMELDLRNKYNTNVIAIKDQFDVLDVTPSPHYQFMEKDTLIVLGETKKIGEFAE